MTAKAQGLEQPLPAGTMTHCIPQHTAQVRTWVLGAGGVPAHVCGRGFMHMLLLVQQQQLLPHSVMQPCARQPVTSAVCMLEGTGSDAVAPLPGVLGACPLWVTASADAGVLCATVVLLTGVLRANDVGDR
jgi:hypothetical protein